MNTNVANQLWQATCELGDHFSRMGGSARYDRMCESDIALYICYLVYKQRGAELQAFDPRWIAKLESHAGDSHVRAQSLVEQTDWANVSLNQALDGYIDYVNRKMTGHNVGASWEQFCRDFSGAQ